jgi:hypothetical protein
MLFGEIFTPLINKKLVNTLVDVQACGKYEHGITLIYRVDFMAYVGVCVSK